MTNILDIDTIKTDLVLTGSENTEEDINEIIKTILNDQAFSEYAAMKTKEQQISYLLDYFFDRFAAPLEDDYPKVVEDIGDDITNIQVLTQTENRISGFMDEITTSFVEITNALKSTDIDDINLEIVSILFAVILDLLV
jgi:hypothetical protein